MFKLTIPLLLFVAGFNAMAQNRLKMSAASPHASVTVSQLGYESKAWDKIFRPETEQFRALHVVLENSDDRAILATVMIWTYTDVKGVTQKTVLKADSWARPLLGPNDKAEIVKAHSRSIFGPSAVIPETMVGTSGIGNGILPQQFAGMEGFTNPTFDLDLLVFADGEMVGPDTRHASTDFAARYSAGQRVIAAWKAGGAPAVQTLAQSPVDNPTHEELQELHYVKQYAAHLTKFKTIDASQEIDYIANSPKPIALFRK
jgi:hypothetical protein